MDYKKRKEANTSYKINIMIHNLKKCIVKMLDNIIHN